MIEFKVTRPEDDVIVSILQRKEDSKFSFVNLTKGHICQCKFDTIEDAISDMDKQIKEGKIIKYEKLSLKIYIAGKITGLPDYKYYFNKAEEKLTSDGHLCMNPAVLKEGFPWESYMPICFAMIDACDAVYLLSNWKDSKGAKQEYEYANSKNKIIIFE